MRDLDKTLGRDQSDNTPPGSDVVQSDTVGDDVLSRGDFRRTAIPASMEPTRKSQDQEPTVKPYRISTVYDVQPFGGTAGGVQWTALSGEGNGRFNAALDFEAHALLVDNWSAQYVYFPAASKWVAPYQIGVVVAVPRGTTSIDLKFVAPGGLTLPGVAPGAFTTVQAYEGFLPPNSGANLSALIGVGVTRVDIEQVQGITLSGQGDLTANMTATQPGSTTTATNVSGAGAAASITFGSVAGQIHRLTQLSGSYSAAPAGGAISAFDATIGNYINLDVIAGGPTTVPLPPGGIKGTATTALVLQMNAGGGAIVAKITAARITG